MVNSFFSKFTPKEPKFFPLLKAMVDVIKAATDIMIEFVEKGNHENAAEYY
ncbi:MAG: phosphate transport regulator, partial [Bacteroidetes bacterium]|nr:phosphate transport regulator [Bacteroidota bacterium]